MAINTKKLLKNTPQRSYLAKDRDAFLAELVSYAKTFYPDRIEDFSESGVGGLFMDMASFVGDSLSFYLDHQFHELSPETAIENKNLQRHIRTAGVKITGASPAVVDVVFSIIVSAVKSGTKYVPREAELPAIMAGTVVASNSGIKFELIEDLDFASRDRAGNFKAKVILNDVATDGVPETFIMQLQGTCISGTRTMEYFSVENVHIPFRSITLSNENVTEVMSVSDSEGNKYYEVDALIQDTVFRGILNTNEDGDLVKENLEIIPAPYRFIKNTSIDTKLTSVQFGSGDANSLDDDIIPDPSEFAVPLYGKSNFSRFTLDPSNLLNTSTLGISPVNTTITIDYRYGGGLLHNVAARSIRSIDKLLMKFSSNPTPAQAASVRATLDVVNNTRASGGENSLSLEELREKIPAARNAQARIVTKEDLLARVYTMPSNFGRVFRAGVRSNSINPLATQLFIVSRDSAGKLAVSPDTLKKNLSVYLNQFRMISDAIDILDAQVINIGIEFQIATDPAANRNLVIQNIIVKLKNYFDIKHWNIDQAIQISDVENIIFNNEGVVSILRLKFKNIMGMVQGKEYTNILFNVESSTKKGLILPPPGGIFTIQYPEDDILGSAT